MTIRTFINSNFMAVFTCPECGKSKQKDVSKLIKHKAQVKLKVKCDCRHSFSVILERRRSKRKNVRLKGRMTVGSRKLAITVVDISKHGLKLLMQGNIPLKERDIIEVEFSLDDPNGSIVLRQVRVKEVIPPNVIKCEFISYEHHGSLGKYFMFYY